MRGQSPSAYFTQEVLNGFHRRYESLTASLHALALEVEQKKFPSKGCREWTHRSTAISGAVRLLIAGKTPPPLTGKHKKRGVRDVDALFKLDEEMS